MVQRGSPAKTCWGPPLLFALAVITSAILPAASPDFWEPPGIMHGLLAASLPLPWGQTTPSINQFIVLLGTPWGPQNRKEDKVHVRLSLQA